jgi:hypothetical protein
VQSTGGAFTRAQLLEFFLRSVELVCAPQDEAKLNHIRWIGHAVNCAVANRLKNELSIFFFAENHQRWMGGELAELVHEAKDGLVVPVGIGRPQIQQDYVGLLANFTQMIESLFAYRTGGKAFA